MRLLHAKMERATGRCLPSTEDEYISRVNAENVLTAQTRPVIVETYVTDEYVYQRITISNT